MPEIPRVKLDEQEWRRILNLLSEELEVWEDGSLDKVEIGRLITTIERQTRIHKKVE